MTNPVFFGPNILRWCDNCNIPILKSKKCSLCDNETRSVIITPPFDVRPAIFGIEKLKKIINSNYGTGASSFLKSKIVLFNRAPDLDSLDEVILDGVVVGKLMFNPISLEWQFKPTIDGALRIISVLNRVPKWFLIDDGAEPYIRKGANVLAPGITDFDKSARKDDFVFVVNRKKELIALGKCRFSSNKINTMKKGLVVKVYQYIKDKYPLKILKGGQNWDLVIEANRAFLERNEMLSRRIIRDAIKKYPGLPIILSFSGGKDSLCTLLITKEELDNNFNIIFLNTGIEFPETVEYTKKIIKQLGLYSKLIIGDAKDRFWQEISKFGFPARDYRWCNKLLKLDIMKKIISENFEGKVLTIIGARKRESKSRYNEKIISENKNIKTQINVNIIHNWTTLTVWLFIFMKGVEFNPIYKNNFNRIGCWLCPSNKLSELKMIESTHPELYNKLIDELKKFQTKIGASDKFIRHGFWRWRVPSSGMKQLAKKLNISLDVDYNKLNYFNW
ncbi:MAG: phosphoadenosine phosphosulfate reductase domain-containing protein [Candidatus Helarchaeota archaeon]